MAEINFVTTDAEALLAELIADCESFRSQTLAAGDPVRLYLDHLCSALIQLRGMINYAAKMNVPRYAIGDYLDVIGETFREVERIRGSHAMCTLRFTLSEAQNTAITIPAGTRVSTADGKFIFATDLELTIPPTTTTASVTATCTVDGTEANAYQSGSLTKLVDVFPYFGSVTNTDATTGGSECETDAAYYERIRLSTDTWSTAGSSGAYQYYAKTASADIVDVAVVNGGAGIVQIYPLMSGGALPNAAVLSAVQAACSADDVRPLTDSVTAIAPTQVSYSISFTYYIAQGDSGSLAAIQAAVAQAVLDYKAWQQQTLGRDINPSKLHQLIMEAGAKRVVMSSPAYTVLSATQVAACSSTTASYGGLEAE